MKQTIEHESKAFTIYTRKESFNLGGYNADDRTYTIFVNHEGWNRTAQRRVDISNLETAFGNHVRQLQDLGYRRFICLPN